MKTSALIFKLFGYWFSFRISIYKSCAVKQKGRKQDENDTI